MKIDWTHVEVLTFDCYGTLIDWETGLLSALMPIFLSHQKGMDSAKVLELYADFEGEAERGPFQNYKAILQGVMDRFAKHLNVDFNDTERKCLVESVKHWQPFPDTIDSLRRLKAKYKLAVISNTDDDIFSFTQQHLVVKFDWIITAEQVKSYKPSLNNFLTAIKKIGVPADRIVHVAQSLYHDVAPANQLGLRTVWINRRQGQEGHGATLSGNATPDVVLPDLRSLADLVGVP
ncbi:MAG: haloacid dehalogenase, type [Bacteroidetes bacterium]|nr:haloacid dehalogenase, type [Bacteroidota bacterium]